MRLDGARLVACGDAALAVHFEAAPSPALARRIGALHAALRTAAIAGYVESIPGLTTLTVLFDPRRADVAHIERDISVCLAHATDSETPARAWDIPVCYEADLAPDLAGVARACGLSVPEAIALHSERTYTVYLIGFSPGFPYLGDLDPRLALPRRPDPRPRVPAGAVAVATHYTAIYPQATPGGWHLIGSTPVSLFDAGRDPPARLATGDTVRFHPIDRAQYDRLRAA